VQHTPLRNHADHPEGVHDMSEKNGVGDSSGDSGDHNGDKPKSE
jgi:hypothetical protein